MDKVKTKILMLVEGAKTDIRLMTQLLSVYGLDNGYEIVSYNTNIYTLYKQMFQDHDPESYDILQVLKEQETDSEKRKVFDQVYSDILLVFDLDPHAPDYSREKIQRMVDYFQESSDMGKLYLNYPMVESFYHMKSIPDPDYDTYTASITELKAHHYKSWVGEITHDQRKFATTKDECSVIIKQNIAKGRQLTQTKGEDVCWPPVQREILDAQLQFLSANDLVYVLCTSPFYIADYNPKLLE